MIGSAFTTSRYSSRVPRHCLDSRAARSSLITRSKLLRSAIGYLLRVRVIECWAVLLPERGGNGRAVIFLEPILALSITEPRICNKLHKPNSTHSDTFRINWSPECKFALDEKKLYAKHFQRNRRSETGIVSPSTIR